MTGRLTREDVDERLDFLGLWHRGNAAQCPAHEDDCASLSLGEGDDGQVLLYCHASCTFEDVIDALKGTSPDGRRFRSDPERRARAAAKSRMKVELVESGPPYLYVSTTGATMRKQRCQVHDPGEPDRVFKRTFRWAWDQGDGRWSPHVTGLTPLLYEPPVNPRVTPLPNTPSFVVEGERDANGLAERGYKAYSVAFGASADEAKPKWLPEWTAQLHDVDNLVIVADDDEPGHAHARAVARVLRQDRPDRPDRESRRTPRGKP